MAHTMEYRANAPPETQAYGVYYDPNHEAATDSEEKTNRGNRAMLALLSLTSQTSLRRGFLLQQGAIVLGIIITLTRRFQLFSFDLFAMHESLRHDRTYTLAVTVLQLIWLLGSLSLFAFHVFLPDNSAYSRGFRSGSRLLSTAATLDIISSTMHCSELLYAATFLNGRWWLRYMQTAAGWCLSVSATLLHSTALAMYALAIFYLESYSPAAENDKAAYVGSALLALCSLAELTQTLYGLGAIRSILKLVALAAAFIWALDFEPAINATAPALDDNDYEKCLLAED